MRFKLLSIVATAVGVAVLMMSLAGTSSGAKQKAAQADRTQAKKLTIVTVSGPLSDPFFSAWKKGADAAAKQLGVTHQYLAPKDLSNIAVDLATFTKVAIAKRPAGIAIGNFIPPVTGPLIKDAIKKGIPVAEVNSGLTSWETDGAITFIGENPVAMGAAAGKAEVQAGVKNGICVNHVPENPVLQQRCDGYIAVLKKAGGSGKTIKIPSADAGNPTAVQQAIAGALAADPKVNGIFTLGVGIADDALKAVGSKKIKVGTTDLSLNVLNEVKNGQLLFAIDQQPYLQGYYSVLALTQFNRYGLHPASAISSGPLLITKANVAKVLAVQKQYGIRGAS